MKLRCFLFALLSTLALHAASDLPVFNATLTVGKEHRFILISPAGKTSAWLKLGEAFEGYQLKAYDAKASALDLEHDGQAVRVTLVADAAVTNAPVAPTPATIADAEEVFRVMHFDEMMKKILDGQKKGMLPAMQQSMKQMMGRFGDALSEEDKAALSALQSKIAEQSLNAITSPEMRSAMARIYSEVFTKDELNSMAGFYSTPAGQALVDKQPDVQQKMMSVMMPMIMKNQMAAQKEMADFMGGLKAKYSNPGAAPGAPAAAPSASPAAAPAPKP
jgi:hypothetical protein